MNTKSPAVVYVCSDSLGETAETVVRASLRQFETHEVQIKRYAHVKSEEEIRALMEDAASHGSFVVYTLVLPELREAIREEAVRLNVFAVDVMGPVMEAFVGTFNATPKRKPGLLHTMDQEYYRRIEAIEFTVKCDDGQDAASWKHADLVVLGVSRTSKTPLSIFLAHKGLKVANLPLVPEVRVPQELFAIPPSRLVGLTMKPEKLVNIRAERLKSMGLPFGASYATLQRVKDELEYAEAMFKKLCCRVIDVTERAIEETAATILEDLANRRTGGA